MMMHDDGINPCLSVGAHSLRVREYRAHTHWATHTHHIHNPYTYRTTTRTRTGPQPHVIDI